MENHELRLAVLIDADNASRTAMRGVMAEIAVYGTPTIKRIYGDWTTPNMGSWKPVLLENAIQPIQQYSYTTGKNATDSAMIIDAMDILYAGRSDGFVLVSSDSDFTRLATRLREAGMKVIGMGERKTPSPFIVACDKFIYIEVIRARAEADKLRPDIVEPSKSSTTGQGKRRKKTEEPTVESDLESPVDVGRKIPPAVEELIAEAIEVVADEDGYAFMGELGNLLAKRQPDFDPRNYGFSKLTQMIKSMERFEVDVRQTSNPHTKHIYLRERRRK